MRIEKQHGVRTFSLLASFLVVAMVAAVAQDSVPPPELPDSPGTVAGEKANTDGSSQESAAQAAPSSNPQSGNGAVQKPVGTAAAEKPETAGVAASNASGAAIAPARQRRSRALLIKMGAIVGAGVAVGTVAALSAASPSRPPGSH